MIHSHKVDMKLDTLLKIPTLLLLWMIWLTHIKMIHQIWLAPVYKKEQIVEEIVLNILKYNQDFCKENNIKYKLWTEKDLKEFNLDELYHNYKNAYICDIMRCHILSKYGGMYIDADDKILDKNIINYIPNDDSISVRLHEEIGVTNDIIAVKRGYSFDEFLDNYDITIGAGVMRFNKFIRQNDYNIIPPEMFKDYAVRSWKIVINKGT